MFSGLTTLLASLIVVSVTSLHLLDTTQAQIDALKSQQSSFQQTVNKLITNITEIERAVNNTPSIDGKVLILQNAITSERQTVFQLSKIIIPPFNISKDGCEKMTDQQKVELLNQLAKARDEVNQLKAIAAAIPPCDDINQVNRDIEKQIFFLNSIESIIYTNCSMNVILSPTIWQTNIYAPNWVLGNMTIDDLIQQYYQRSIRYDNITNCPIEFPFFDGKQCIQCSGATPAFDISQKKCIACPPDNHIDLSSKKCVPNSHYTNWTTVVNYSPRDGPFPTPADGATPCPKQFPYWNTTHCISCQMPLYFDVISQTCKPCSNGTVFNVNTRECSPVMQNMLTRLQGTRWVTPAPNVTNVLQERANILDANKTSGIYHQCPPQAPYFDGQTCINCDYEFSLNTLKCVSAPNGTQFDPNVHIYIPPQVGETPQNAPNLIGQPAPDNPNVVNCNSTAPYYDGVGCINCPAPFVLFDLNSKQCVVCDPQNMYNATSRACEPRPTIYISNNDNNLMATPNRSIDDYHNNITNTIQNNPNAIIVNCQDPAQYSNYKQCFPCGAGQYFNVQTFQCDTCPYQVDNVTRLCKQPAYLFTNLSAPNIVNLANPSQQQQNINTLLSQNNASKVCPIATPYSNGTTCISCPTPNIFFDYVAKKCIGCPAGSFLSNNQCYAIPIVSNASAIEKQGNYLQVPPNGTVAAIRQVTQNLTNNNIPYNECPVTAPYFNPTTNSCTQYACPSGSYLSLANKTCVACPTYDPITHTCPPPIPRYPNLNDTNWISSNIPGVIDYRNTLRNVNGSVICPLTQPHYNGVQCVNCTAGQQFNYDTKQCVSCPAPTVYDNNIHYCLELAPVGKYQTNIQRPGLIYGTTPKNQWLDYYNSNKTAYPNIQDCPTSTPYYDGINCIQCPANVPYFSLQQRICMTCPDGYTYSDTATFKGCLSSSGASLNVTPDIAKMYANIF